MFGVHIVKWMVFFDRFKVICIQNNICVYSSDLYDQLLVIVVPISLISLIVPIPSGTEEIGQDGLAFSYWGTFDDSFHDKQQRKRPFACQCPGS